MANPPANAAFIGGAEKARRMARKRMNQPPAVVRSNPGNKRASTPPYPKSMRPHDRYFGSLLYSSVQSLIESQDNAEVHRELMTHACSLLGVPNLPTPPVRSQFQRSMSNNGDARSHHLLQRASSFLTDASSTTVESTLSSSSRSSSTFSDAKSYYMSKAPLILEESRCVIADSLKRLSVQKTEACSLSLQLVSIDEKYPQLAHQHKKFAPSVLNFKIEKINSREQSMSWSRPGNVFLLCPSHVKPTNGNKRIRDENIHDMQQSVLACFAPMGQNKSDGTETSGKSSSLSLMIFHRGGLDLSSHLTADESKSSPHCNHVLFHATALTTLISHVRQMEACLRMTKVSFMPKLLGHRKSSHIRFNDSDDEEIVETGTSSEECVFDNEEAEVLGSSVSSEKKKSLQAKLPQLNPTQERAASSFLNSLPSSLILVQGPPGTGKTTFLVNVICRRLATDPSARLLVTAPTNKAVTVLAKRFFDVMNTLDDSIINNCNPVLVGVEDKLMFSSSDKNDDEYILSDALTASLQSIFAYTWLKTVKAECAALLDDLENLNNTNSQTADEAVELLNRARRIHNKLSAGIPNTSIECYFDAEQLVQKLEAVSAANSWDMSTEDTFSFRVNHTICHAQNLLATLDTIDSNDVVSELLSTARVIFCTLSTAGASIIKQTHQIDDLLVDEAAAATEAEICIPFHLRPKRMLAVGDPMQLPPTIMSRNAAELGFSKSMHDRLMNDLDEEFFMLDRQYRMAPTISHFPCNQFYDGIMNGENVMSPYYSREIIAPMTKPYSFIHINGVERKGRCGSYSNHEECVKIVEIVETLRTKARGTDWDSHDRLRIITFYSAQAVEIKRLLAKKRMNKVLVATVDSSQGCEADIVLVSFTRSNNKKGVLQAAGFLADDRRINVAITRARHQLICVGNALTLGSEGSDTLQQLVLDAKQRECIIE